VRTKRKPYRLYTSIGQQTWEMQLYFARQAYLDQTIVIPAKNATDFEILKQNVITQYCLDLNQVQFEKIYPDDSKSLMYSRDARIIENSDLLVPIAIRNNGYLNTLINQAPHQKHIINDFQIEYKPEKAKIAYKIDKNKLSKELFFLSSQYLTHWTRTSNSPWPTEKKFDYYQAITTNNCYPRSAFEGLANMLTHGKINASSLHMPQNTPTVSFSGLPPQEAAVLMYWRARYCQMSFEPYGIGIEKNDAESIGIQAVRYYKPRFKPKNVDSWLCQSIGKKSNWRLENEYRFLGDLDLIHIPNEKMICFCYSKNEAKKIQNRFGIRSIGMIDVL
jgi:hypothetical protein